MHYHLSNVELPLLPNSTPSTRYGFQKYM